MSLVCLMMGLRVPLSPPHLTMTSKASPRALDLGGGGGGGLLLLSFWQGCAARILKTPTPIHIKAKHENDTYSYIFPRGNPMGFAFTLTTVCFYTQGQILVCRVRMPIAVYNFLHPTFI